MNQDMEQKDYLKLAKEYAMKQWRFDIVLPAGEEEGWHYFSCTREGRPKYSSMPTALRINESRKIEEVKGDAIFKVIATAHRLIRNIQN